jgi:plastocyanin
MQAIAARRLSVVLLLSASAADDAAHARTKTYTLRMGPVLLGKYQVRQDTTAVRFPNVNGYITRMSTRVVDGRGRRIPVKRVMLHHVLFSNRGRKDGQRHDGACPDIPRERVFGTGEENQVLRLPRGYGIPVHREERWQAAWMLMNHRPDLDTGYLEYRVTIATGRRLDGVKGFWLDVAGCRAAAAYTVAGGAAPGSTDTRSATWTVPADGRLVAGGAHLHGSAKRLALRQPRCRNRELPGSRPLYGMAYHPAYNVLPILHEPGPIDTSWFMTRTGIPLVEGEQIIAESHYDGEFPHPRVMGIDHVYMAFDRKVQTGCAPLPRDLTNTNRQVPGRRDPPYGPVPLTGTGPEGLAQTIERPQGDLTSLPDSATIEVRGSVFQYPNLSIPLGASLTWNFFDGIRHNVTLANGPEGLSSPDLRAGAGFTHHFTRPGTYRLFCTLHPIYMHQVVDVLAAPAPTPRPVRPRRSREADPIRW